MNKKLFIIMICTTLMISILSSVTADMENDGAYMEKSSRKILFNDVEMNFLDNEYNRLSSYIYNGITYVPLRSFSEQIGKDVEWDQKNDTIDINDKKRSDLEGIYFGDIVNDGHRELVSIINLIANPKDYQDKKILVNGIITVAFEMDNLFLTREDMHYWNTANSIPLNFRTDNKLGVSMSELEKISTCYVELQGVFDDGLIKDITYISVEPYNISIK